jgi:GT2 family glycosyltransferase
VPKDWLRKLKAAFEKDPKIGIVFCNVQAADYDHSTGFIPAYVRQDEALLKTTSDKLRGRGIGAGMAVRKSIILALGGYDELLGTGSHFPSCEDGDMALRTILGGYYVLETHTTYVIHEGFRNWAQGKPLARNNWIGIGAAYAKPLRCGRWEALNVVLYEAFWIALVNAFRPLLRLKKPQGLRNFYFFWVGFFKGLAHPVEKSLMLYR